MNWTNVFTWLRSIGVGILGLAGSIAAQPAGTFDPHTTAVATGIAAAGAALAAASHIGVEAVNPKTFPQTALTAATVVQEVAPGTQAAKDVAVVQAVVPLAQVAIQAIQQVHADAVGSATEAPKPGA